MATPAFAVKIKEKNVPFLTQGHGTTLDNVRGYIASIEGWLWGKANNDITNRLNAIKNDGTFSLNFADPLFQNLSLGTTEYWYQHVPIYQLSDNAAKTIGKHTVKAGFYWQRRDERDNDVIRSMNIGGDCSGCGETTNYTGRGPFSNDGSGWNTLAEFVTGDVANMIREQMSGYGPFPKFTPPKR